MSEDALELFDVVMTSQLLALAERQSATDQARRYPRVSREASKLAAAVGVLLEATGIDQEMPLERIWDVIENVVPRSELWTAVALIHEVAPPGVDPEQQWQRGIVRPVAGGPQVRARVGRDDRVRRDRGRRPGADKANRRTSQSVFELVDVMNGRGGRPGVSRSRSGQVPRLTLPLGSGGMGTIPP